MLELLALFIVGGLILGFLLFVGLAVKLFFKLLLIPFALAAGLLKLVLMFVVGVVLFTVFGALFAVFLPVILIVGLVLLPLLILGGLCWLGVAAVGVLA